MYFIFFGALLIQFHGAAVAFHALRISSRGIEIEPVIGVELGSAQGLEDTGGIAVRFKQLGIELRIVQLVHEQLKRAGAVLFGQGGPGRRADGPGELRGRDFHQQAADSLGEAV